MSLIVVAILGRPNVGKSTLFNRIVGRRAAIVDDTPGVTRDRIEGRGRLAGLEMAAIDTAGLDDGPPDSLAGRLRRQSETALAEADVGLLVIDAKAGLTPLDISVAEWARRHPKPVLLVANKCEGRAAEAFAAEAWSLGLGEPIALSARTGEGFADLAEALRPFVPEAPEPVEGDADAEEEAGPIRMVVVGRPNVGKSSLINRLIAEERLLTGPEPGLTRDAVSLRWTWRGRDFALIDTAGLRRKARVTDDIEQFSTRATVEALKFAHVVVLMTEATAALERQDAIIADLAAQEGRGVVLALNKWDLVDDPRAALDLIGHRVDRRLPQIKGVLRLPMSVLTGKGVNALLPAVAATYDRWNTRVSTSRLNRWLEGALGDHPPPLVQGRRVKVRYMTQVKARPPSFLLFGNQVKALPEAYLRYLTGGLRDAFDLKGVPIRIGTRQGENPFAGG